MQLVFNQYILSVESIFRNEKEKIPMGTKSVTKKSYFELGKSLLFIFKKNNEEQLLKKRQIPSSRAKSSSTKNINPSAWWTESIFVTRVLSDTNINK